MFSDDLGILEAMMKKHETAHDDIMNFQQQIEQCSARNVELNSTDSTAYWEMLNQLGNEYDQLKVNKISDIL